MRPRRRRPTTRPDAARVFTVRLQPRQLLKVGDEQSQVFKAWHWLGDEVETGAEWVGARLATAAPDGLPVLAVRRRGSPAREAHGALARHGQARAVDLPRVRDAGGGALASTSGVGRRPGSRLSCGPVSPTRGDRSSPGLCTSTTSGNDERLGIVAIPSLSLSG